jgi:hypothetical protein
MAAMVVEEAGGRREWGRYAHSIRPNARLDNQANRHPQYQ